MLVLLYAVEVLPLTKTDVARLDHALDRAIFRILAVPVLLILVILGLL